MARGAYHLLTRHFLRGFVENDLVSPDEGLGATLAPLLAAIAAPGLLVPMIWSFAYGWPYRTVEAFQSLAIRHEVMLVLLPMVVVALVTVLQGDAVYPDRRDAEVLGRLPVRLSTLFAAKVTALLLFVAAFAVAANGFASIVYPMVANMRPQPGAPGIPVTFMAHVVATFGGAAFAALSVLAMLGALQAVLPARVGRAVSPVVQTAAVVALVLTFLMLPFLMMAIDPRGGGQIGRLASLRGMADLHGWLPPVWFLGWYEDLAGRGGPATRVMAQRAQGGLAVAALATVFCYALAYRRHASGAALRDTGVRPASARARRAAAAWRRLVTGGPAEDAYLAFVARTGVRSPKHRLLIAAAVGIGLAFVLAEATVGVQVWREGRPAPQLLSVQFVLAIFLLTGLRLAFAVPSALRANWSFRVNGPERAVSCRTATRRAVITCALGPLLVLLAPVHAALYGWWVAAAHGLFGLLACLTLLELQLAGFPKIPFAAPFVPGRAQLKSRLTVYVVGFQFFGYILAQVESLTLRSGWATAALLLVAAGCWRWAAGRRRARAGHEDLVFEEAPPDALLTLDLGTAVPRARQADS